MLYFLVVRLDAANEGDVVRNCKNGSYYRYERPEKNRSRIRPLELFPNGLLIPKSADTIVEPTLEVDAVGRWSEDTEDFFVNTEVPAKVRQAYADELEAKTQQLVQVEQEMLTVDNSHGGRGSHANKIKAVARRVQSLERGLADRPKDVKIQKHTASKAQAAFRLKDLVQLPSGRPAIVLSADPTLIGIMTKTAGGPIRTSVPAALLRPLEHRHLATV